MTASTGDIQRGLGQLFGVGSAVGLTDDELLARSIGVDRHAAEQAFETILARHGSMVLTVCRQVLGDAHAAEDAFQATFLVLLRRAGSLRLREGGSLGSWLYGVAFHTAKKARRGLARRQARERRAVALRSDRGDIDADRLEHDELAAALHAEVHRLPEKYRAPIVLCDFEGRTHPEAAAALGCPVGTVRGHLARARELLRNRLARRGGMTALGPLLVAPSIASVARAQIPVALRTATVSAAIGGTASRVVAELVRCVLRELAISRLKGAVAAMAALSLFAVGIGLAAQAARPSGLGGSAAGVSGPRAHEEQPASQPRSDRLPPGARMRLGDQHFHHPDLVMQVVFTPNGRSIVTLDQSGQVRVWDAATGLIASAIGEPKLARQMDVSADGKTLATLGWPTGLRLWDLATGRERRRWHVAERERHDRLALSPDGRTLAVSVTRARSERSRDFEEFLDLFDTDAPTERRRRIPANGLRLLHLHFAPDGRTLVAATDDRPPGSNFGLVPRKPEKGSARLWDVATGRELRRFEFDGALPHWAAFSPDGRRLVVYVSDRTVRSYDPSTGKEIQPRLNLADSVSPASSNHPHPDWASLVTHDHIGASSLAFTPDGKTLVIGSPGSGSTGEAWVAGVYLWDLARGKIVRRIPAHLAWTSSVSVSPDGRTLATTGAENVVRVWDMATGRETLPQTGHASSVHHAVVSPIDGTIFTTGQDGLILAWDPATGASRGVFARFSASIVAMVMAADGRTLLTLERFGAVKLWDAAERREVRRLAQNGRPGFSNAGFSSDGRHVVAVGRSEFRTWDVATGREVPGSIRIGIPVGQEVRSADGRYEATGGVGPRLNHFLAGPASRDQMPNDPTICVRELATGRGVAAFPGPASGTSALAFSPDGRLLASASGTIHGKEPSTVQVWEIATGRERRRFEGHRSGVNALAFAPDSRSLISGGEDGTIYVWDLEGSGVSRPAAPEAGDRSKRVNPAASPGNRALP